MELLIGYFKNIPIKNWGRGVSSVICTQRGVVAREHVRTVGMAGQIFAILVRTY